MSKPTIVATISAVILLAVAFAVLAAGRGSKDQVSDITLPPGQTFFETVAQGGSSTAGVEKPSLFIASTGAESSRLASLLEGEPTFAERIGATDLKRNLLVGVFRGQFGNSGYEVVIEEIQRTGEGVRISVQLRNPSPGQAVIPIMAYPYHIVAVPREQLPLRSGMIWEAYDQDGNLFAQTQYP